jgi:hypothetical protein
MIIKSFDKSIKLFDDYIFENKNDSDNNTESMKNYKKYISGSGEPLRYAFITHKEGDSAFDFIKSKVTNNFSVFPKDHWEKVLKNHRSKLQEVLKNRNKWNS